jgi:death-on-curing protein
MKPHFFVFLISSADVIRFHTMIIDQFGGRAGIRDYGLLDSAINHPLMIITYGEESDYEIHHLAAAYFYGIIKNHAFVDGNKRTAVVTTLEFMSRNGFELEADFDELYQLALDAAMSRIKPDQIAAFFQKSMRSR